MATAWVLTGGMTHLKLQINRVGPNRDTASDGSIGDLAHQNESASSHNPDKTGAAEWKDGDSKNEVRAIDVDNSGPWLPGVTAEKLVQFLVTRGRNGDLEKRIRYIIYNERIWTASNNWVTQKYTGASQHKEHIHFTGAYTQASDEDSPQYDYKLEELAGMATSLTTDDVNAIVGAIRNAYSNPQDDLASISKAAPWQYGNGIAAAGLQYSGKSALYQFTMIAANVEAIKASLASVAAGDDTHVSQLLASLDAKMAEVATAVDQVDENVLAKLGNPNTPDEVVASTLVSLLGSRKDAIVALMASA